MSGHFPSNAIKNSAQWPSDAKLSIKKPDFFSNVEQNLHNKKSALISGGNVSGIQKGMANMSFESIDQFSSPMKSFGKTQEPNGPNAPATTKTALNSSPTDYVEINPGNKIWNAASLQQQKQQKLQQNPKSTVSTSSAVVPTPSAVAPTPSAVSSTPSAVSPTPSAVSPTSSDEVPTSSAVIPTPSDEVSTSSVVVPTSSDEVSTSSDEVSTSSDVIPTSSDSKTIIPSPEEGNPTPIPGSSSSFLLKVNPSSNIEEEITGQNLYKTELCRSYEETGNCRYGTKCQFAHGKTEQRPVLRHPKYKTEVCKTFHTIGTCPYGKRCRFIHILPDGAPPPPDSEDEELLQEQIPQPLKAQVKVPSLQNVFSSNPNEWSTSWNSNSSSSTAAAPKSNIQSTMGFSSAFQSSNPVPQFPSSKTSVSSFNGKPRHQIFSSKQLQLKRQQQSQETFVVESTQLIPASSLNESFEFLQPTQQGAHPTSSPSESVSSSLLSSPPSSSASAIPSSSESDSTIERQSRLAFFHRLTSDQDS